MPGSGPSGAISLFSLNLSTHPTTMKKQSISLGLIGLALVLGLSFYGNSASAKAYKGAEIYSFNSYLYGRYELRMRVAKGSGLLSTFFTYKNGSEVTNTFWEEIDLEVLGKNNASQWQSNVILGDQRPTISSEILHPTASSLAEAYHTYVLEWTPDYVAWYLDGVEVRRINGTSTVTSLTNPESVRMNIWASESTDWVGNWDDSVLPVYQFVDYIAYARYDAESKTFVADWRDDFNSFDTSRWGKADWTFDGNRVDFAPENALVKDGYLVLALTPAAATGFSGQVPADNASSSSAVASSSASVTTSSSMSSTASSSSSSSSAEASSVIASSASSLADSSSSSSASSSFSASSKATGNSGGSGGGGVQGPWSLALLTLLLLVKLAKFRRRH